MKIVLKGVPPSLNAFAGRQNPWEYRKAKAEWTDAVAWAVLAAGKPPVPYHKARITITYFFPTNARHDADNYAGKFLLDGLTKAGVIVDDDLKHITTTIIGKVDKNNPRTEIEVEEMKNDE